MSDSASRCLSADDVRDYVLGQPVEERVADHLRTDAVEDGSCECHPRLTATLDTLVVDPLQSGLLLVNFGAYMQGLGTRLTRRHLCPESMSEEFLFPQSDVRQAMMARHLQVCPLCRQEMEDILEVSALDGGGGVMTEGGVELPKMPELWVPPTYGGLDPRVLPWAIHRDWPRQLRGLRSAA